MWWLSFADPDLPEGSQFLGVCVIEEEDFLSAIQHAHALKINPGGEVKGVKLSENFPPIPKNKLMNRAQLTEYVDIQRAD
jgi:hypothetical protein